ncbi:MAG: hypothetical protein JWM85_2119 [Acidimicrobiaceae bacterium]|nr:hypothetical protein [Acidimicrobiaceae bacterium]
MLTESMRFERECAGKRSYRSPAEARRWQRDHASRVPGTERLKPYQCTWCERYHLGHPLRAKWAVSA